MEIVTSELIFARAGRLIDEHAMFWVRKLKSPIEMVWQTVSTKEGLERWWIVPPKSFELKLGGSFKHHWNNTITDFTKNEFIDFLEASGAYAETGGMRFELAPTEDGATYFMFMDTWYRKALPPSDTEEQPGGPGTPWPGVAAGWHAMVDRLERVFDDEAPQPTYDELQRFYVPYLRDIYRWHRMVKRID